MKIKKRELVYCCPGRSSWLLLLLLAALLPGCATTSPPLHQPREIAAELRCAICGMPPAAQPRWQSQIIMGDGRQVVFDSPKDMFRYLQLLHRYDYAGKQGLGKGLAMVWVRDYQTGAWLDGLGAWYVVGSEELGPTGRELVPFTGRAAAEAFSRQHGGKVAGFTAIDPEMVKGLGD